MIVVSAQFEKYEALGTVCPQCDCVCVCAFMFMFVGRRLGAYMMLESLVHAHAAPDLITTARYGEIIA